MKPAGRKSRMSPFLAVALAAVIPGGCPVDSGDGSGQALLYVLQPERTSVDALENAAFKWLVLEPSRSGGAAGEFSVDEIESIRAAGPCGDKIVLAYLSIGEAEDERDYWDPAWVAGAEGPPISGVAPAWLGPSNPDFRSNYKVRYWQPEWQAIVLGTSGGSKRTPLDRIIDAGFDGVYLDIVDAFEFWSAAEGGNELTRAEARRRMIEWVRAIAEYARTTRGVTDFLVFPQNGAEIILDDDDELDDLSATYFAAIDGIGIEDLFYDETTPQSSAEVQRRLNTLDEFQTRSKTVLVTDYVLSVSPTPANGGDRVASFYQRTLGAGFVPYAALVDRELDEVVTLSAETWPVAQPLPCTGTSN